MNNKAIKRAVSMLVIVVVCFTLFSFGTSAVSLDTKGSITLTTLSKESKKPISGAVFRVYRIASAYAVGDGIGYVYTDEFKNNGMEMGNFSDAYLPVHLSAYAVLKAISYTEKATDSSGKVVFDNLQCGAYLVVPVGIDEGYLNPTPFIVTVPMKDETENKWVYNVDATPKIGVDKDETTEKTYISVKKYWQSKEKNPESITVSLVKDGVITDTVTLHAGNNWYYRWDDLDKNHSWNVVETLVPSGYNVSYVSSEMTVIITNTKEGYEEETTTSHEETTTAPEETTSPDETTKPDDTTRPDNTTESTTGHTDVTESTTQPIGTTDSTEPTDVTQSTTSSNGSKETTTRSTGSKETTTKPEELIKTGQLNWPVPVLSIVGLLLFSMGWAMFNFSRKDEEEV